MHTYMQPNKDHCQCTSLHGPAAHVGCLMSCVVAGACAALAQPTGVLLSTGTLSSSLRVEDTVSTYGKHG